MGELVTSEILAKRLSLRPSTIRRWVRAGIIPCLRFSGKVVRFDVEQVESALRKIAAKRENDDRCSV